MEDELISVGFRYIRRAEVASESDIKYWAEISDKKLAQQALEFIKEQSNQGTEADAFLAG